MLKIHHRVNDSSRLSDIPKTAGVEIDLRSWKQSIVVTHDVYTDAESLDTWLKNYNHSKLILNVKEEGIEEKILGLVRSANIDSYFFLDQSFPWLVKTIRSGEVRTAIRISDFESPLTALSVQPRPNWIWADSFSGDWGYLNEWAERLKERGFQICVASPELHGRQSQVEFNNLQSIVNHLGNNIDAVCTKVPEKW
jgi:hypothetical protein